MKTASSVVVRWMGAALLLAATAGAQEPEKDWEVRQINGMDYVRLENVGKFYRLGGVERNGNEISLEEDGVKVEFTIGSTDCRFNRMKVVLEQRILENEGKFFVSRGDLGRLIDPILRPDFIKGAGRFTTVILDTGGGEEPEGDAARHALVIAGKARTRLEKHGMTVVMIREEGKVMTTEERIRLANGIQEPATFIGIAFEGRKDQPKGMRTSALMPPTGDLLEKGEGNSPLSTALGTALHGSVLRKLGTNTQDNGLSGDRQSALAGIRHPAIELTVANLADEYDAKLAANEKYQDAVADGIADGVMKYRLAVTRQAE